MNATENTKAAIRKSYANDANIQDLNVMRLNYLLQKEIGTAMYLRTERSKIHTQQQKVEREEQHRLLTELPQLTMTRMLVQELHAQALHERDTVLRQEYLLRYQAIQQEYDLLSQEYNEGVHHCEIRRMTLTRTVEKFNNEVARHNQSLIQPSNKVNQLKRLGDE